ncbi:MAG TPA: hypothetical protein VES89_10775 [Candidatus Competibacteraceae bacterium]|nr:hypothetical protein [Candidatus Competibacteraceae bacterium]
MNWRLRIGISDLDSNNPRPMLALESSLMPNAIPIMQIVSQLCIRDSPGPTVEACGTRSKEIPQTLAMSNAQRTHQFKSREMQLQTN